ncbi:MAG: exodeoxyribonuclease VII large subunit [Desulfuromonadia bacterium]
MTGADQRVIVSVSELTRLLRGVIEENFSHVWVQGEISNLATPASGHVYFTLKDPDAQINAVLFKGVASHLKFRLADGMAVIVRGRVTVYPPRGSYQIVIDYLEPAGIGSLQLAFMQLREKLEKEGLFDPARKRGIPPYPRRVGVVTSPSGAAIHDIITVLHRRSAPLDLLILPVRVQGEGAAEEIARAIHDFNRIGGVDVLIVGRGGGSLEDLWAFNEEVVARAIAASRIPVISAVGHEVDVTISDFVADLRAPTPSAAAEMVARSGVELQELVTLLSRRLTLAAAGALSRWRERLSFLTLRLRDPQMVIGFHRIRLDDLEARLDAATSRTLADRRRRLADLSGKLPLLSPQVRLSRQRERHRHLSELLRSRMLQILSDDRQHISRLSSTLDALSPLAVLGRGYAVAFRLNTSDVVTDAATLSPGDPIRLRLKRGGAVCRVEEPLPES